MELLRSTVSSSSASSLLSAYLPCGYPMLSATVPLMLALEKGGARMIELGVPFSDPLADGSTIQNASSVALRQNVSLEDCIGTIQSARTAGLKIPIVVMSYYNPIMKYGVEKAVADVAEAGANGFIVVDLCAEESGDFVGLCRKYSMSFVPLVAITTSVERLGMICDRVRDCSSFLYCVSMNGVTGRESGVNVDLADFIGRVKSVTKIPLGVGFGISTREDFQRVSEYAKCVVIGSRIVREIESALHDIQWGEGKALALGEVKQICERVEQYARYVTRE